MCKKINIQVKEGDICPQCHKGIILKRHGRYNDFMGCSEYFHCSFTAQIIDSRLMNIKELEKIADEILEINEK